MEMRPADQRRGAGQIQMIAQQHQSARCKAGVDAASGIGQKQSAHAQIVHEPHLGCDLLRTQAFVKMAAPLGDQNWDAIRLRQD